MPTFSPAWKWLPLWRTMILPGITCSPPYTFTPSLCDLLSLPFLVEPAPFFDAIVLPPHLKKLLDRFYQYFCKWLPVAISFTIHFFTFILEYKYFLVFTLCKHFACNLGT